MCSNTKKLAVIYPAVYCKQIVTPHKTNCITATIDKGYDGYGSRPCIMEYEEYEESDG